MLGATAKRAEACVIVTPRVGRASAAPAARWRCPRTRPPRRRRQLRSAPACEMPRLRSALPPTGATRRRPPAPAARARGAGGGGLARLAVAPVRLGSSYCCLLVPRALVSSFVLF